MRLAVVVLLLALVAVPSAVASEERPTSFEVQQELWCADCNTPFAEANATWYTQEALSVHRRPDRGRQHEERSQGEGGREVPRAPARHALEDPTDVPTVADLEDEVMCPACNTTLDQSSSSAARQVEGFIATRIAAGDSKQQIKDRLVADYGPWILAAPPTEGFDLLAWLLPLVGLVGGALVLAALAWHWSRRREPRGGSPELSPALERRVDEELARFDEG